MPRSTTATPAARSSTGHVVGINSQIESESGGSDGIGFAVPSNTLAPVVDELLADGEVEHAYLGVSLQTIPASAARELGLVEGAAVTSVVASSPAASAGLRPATGETTVAGDAYPTGGDVIVAFDGEDVGSSSELRALVDARSPGDAVTLEVLRAGKTVEVEMELWTRAS